MSMACESLPDGGAWLKFILISLFFNDLHSKCRKRLYYLRVENSVWSERNLRPCGGKKCLWRNFSKNHFGAKSVPKTVPEIFTDMVDRVLEPVALYGVSDLDAWIYPLV